MDAFIGHLSTLIERSYLDPDRAKILAADLRAHLRSGGLGDIAEAAKVAHSLTEWLRSRSGDLHFKVSEAGGDPAEGDLGTRLEERRSNREQLRTESNGFVALANHGDGVFSFTFSLFREASREDLDAALTLTRKADALILDFRGHRGGPPETIRYLLSQFLPHGTHYSDTYNNKGFVRKNLTAPEAGPHHRGEVPLLVVVDGRTASGAEAVAFVLKNHKRALVVGEKTLGAAHSGGTWTINGFKVFIPNEKHVNPATGATWEKVGVQPDVPAASAAAFAKAIALGREQTRAHSEARAKSQKLLIEDFRAQVAKLRPATLDAQWQPVRTLVGKLIDTGILDEEAGNDLAYQQLGKRHLPGALAIFSGIRDAFPRSANAEDSLAEAYEAAGRLTDSREHYQRAVTLAEAQGAATLPQHRSGLARIEAKLSAGK